MNIVFFGTSNLALPVLNALYSQEQVVAVVTAPDSPVGRKQGLEESPVSVLAKELNLKIFKPSKIKNNADFFNELKECSADMFVVVAYGKLLPIEVLNLPRYKTINVHPSLLPKYRGPSPIQYALLAGDQVTGTTIMLIDEEMDHGPILAQKTIPIDNDDNIFSLTQKLAIISAEIFLPTIKDFVAGKLIPKPQEHNAATYTKILSKDDGRISWDNSASAIYNQFRAFYLWPGIWSIWKGKKIKITECFPSDSAEKADSGTVLPGGQVACGNGTTLQISRLQMEGKKEMTLTEFLNGNKVFIGSKLD
jgi:methionyl-tRNA formyltransferase